MKCLCDAAPQHYSIYCAIFPNLEQSSDVVTKDPGCLTIGSAVHRALSDRCGPLITANHRSLSPGEMNENR